jgi:Holliday junction resolvase-like predicted endonuclease
MARPTFRRRRGDRAEQLATGHLESLGWRVLARNVAAGRDEVDIVALDPGPPAAIVCVEVRSNTTGRFGAPEESVVGRKVRRLYRSMAALRAAGELPDGAGPLPRGVPWRVDLLVVEDAPTLGPGTGGATIRHLRNVEPA